LHVTAAGLWPLIYPSRTLKSRFKWISSRKGDSHCVGSPEQRLGYSFSISAKLYTTLIFVNLSVKNHKLTVRQIRFVEEYSVDMNATQAAVRAGYSQKTASRIGPELLGKTWVRDAVNDQLAKASSRNALSVDWIVRRLMDEADDFGPRASSSSRVRALELLGKYAGIFVERREESFASQLRQMSDDELQACLQSTRDKAKEIQQASERHALTVLDE
jgi:phage terminase small subunit